ncbi:hypothetical protein DAPPUDRAFT_244192 [Daphnia pulex]|uniref:Uncharacterized protein n=1 Tax=Daphnia pulex TaxID=6669 RepID=E9GKE8_DAPPU|nr:hypothetical protein DAPPUDRAFT_244192 [Daphnia pulex]|eukprot:EFX80077.1 hypothetical protein DAPPUDRAFT_244192 [Daphnia pulex]
MVQSKILRGVKLIFYASKFIQNTRIGCCLLIRLQKRPAVGTADYDLSAYQPKEPQDFDVEDIAARMSRRLADRKHPAASIKVSNPIEDDNCWTTPDIPYQRAPLPVLTVHHEQQPRAARNADNNILHSIIYYNDVKFKSSDNSIAGSP